MPLLHGRKKKSGSFFPAQRPSTSLTSSLGAYIFIATLAELHTCPAGMTGTARAAHRVRDRSSHRSSAPIMLITARATNTSHVLAARRACAIHIVRRSSDDGSFFAAFARVTRCSADPIEPDPVSFYHRMHTLSLTNRNAHMRAAIRAANPGVEFQREASIPTTNNPNAAPEAPPPCRAQTPPRLSLVLTLA